MLHRCRGCNEMWSSEAIKEDRAGFEVNERTHVVLACPSCPPDGRHEVARPFSSVSGVVIANGKVAHDLGEEMVVAMAADPGEARQVAYFIARAHCRYSETKLEAYGYRLVLQHEEAVDAEATE